jgi:hypothetical protein
LRRHRALLRLLRAFTLPERTTLGFLPPCRPPCQTSLPLLAPTFPLHLPLSAPTTPSTLDTGATVLHTLFPSVFTSPPAPPSSSSARYTLSSRTSVPLRAQQRSKQVRRPLSLSSSSHSKRREKCTPSRSCQSGFHRRQGSCGRVYEGGRSTGWEMRRGRKKRREEKEKRVISSGAKSGLCSFLFFLHSYKSVDQLLSLTSKESEKFPRPLFASANSVTLSSFSPLLLALHTLFKQPDQTMGAWSGLPNPSSDRLQLPLLCLFDELTFPSPAQNTANNNSSAPPRNQPPSETDALLGNGQRNRSGSGAHSYHVRFFPLLSLPRLGNSLLLQREGQHAEDDN